MWSAVRIKVGYNAQWRNVYSKYFWQFFLFFLFFSKQWFSVKCWSDSGNCQLIVIHGLGPIGSFPNINFHTKTYLQFENQFHCTLWLSECDRIKNCLFFIYSFFFSITGIKKIGLTALFYELLWNQIEIRNNHQKYSEKSERKILYKVFHHHQK